MTSTPAQVEARLKLAHLGRARKRQAPKPTYRCITHAEWLAEGARRFGPDERGWRFVCPACGHVAAVKEWAAAGAPESAAGFSCIGRWTGARRKAIGGSGPGPCDYAGGGLFVLSPVTVVTEEGTFTVMEFAP